MEFRRWVYDDGGRKAAEFSDHSDDCACRAIAIATGKPYRQVYDELNALCARSLFCENPHGPETGIYHGVCQFYLRVLVGAGQQ